LSSSIFSNPFEIFPRSVISELFTYSMEKPSSSSSSSPSPPPPRYNNNNNLFNLSSYTLYEANYRLTTYHPDMKEFSFMTKQVPVVSLMAKSEIHQEQNVSKCQNITFPNNSSKKAILVVSLH
jgi:hypothetical protein